MTPTEFVDYVRNIHNAIGDPHWSDTEILSLLQGKINESLSIIGLIEAEDSTTSTSGTADVNYPTNSVFIRRVYYKEVPLKLLTFRQRDSRDPTGTLQSGTPREYSLWNNVIELIPKPNTTGDAIRILSEKQQGTITIGGTIDVSAVLHTRYANPVLFMMFMKDENQPMASFYRDIWFQTDIPAFREFKRLRRRTGQFHVVTDVDSVLETEFGAN